MATKASDEISRRQFVASGRLAVVAAWLAPLGAYAQESGLVEGVRKEGAAAKITVQALRRNVSVVMGSGGNIAVLPGREGKRLIDAGLATSHPDRANPGSLWGSARAVKPQNW